MWLTLLRHDGGRSRLPDWTYSFFVALFQAIEKAEDNKDCEEVEHQHLWKIIISSKIGKECLIELQRTIIQNQTLFRGLSGVASDLENQMLMPELFKDIEPTN